MDRSENSLRGVTNDDCRINDLLQLCGRKDAVRHRAYYPVFNTITSKQVGQKVDFTHTNNVDNFPLKHSLHR
ncbi:uncharacterized protein PHALS_09099 [Plasmopara halstedii]|uniref:Uncharacterized protein n=1 Tax=Plasmopara halstedii TaxID=4781 RepID=A0A0P1AF54_PLAHL|nr:uncharacterized protein PHALS_09099 [Plasmopara halstedii]CEG39034.1 hypothetical protein PHALS_09099 [Plasmopara halstedii]|eukprot:XP_024575403.1 hypothetical protein PHALS_09099 [Plasmopara halstedii]